jgi:hypothetical protein
MMKKEMVLGLLLFGLFTAGCAQQAQKYLGSPSANQSGSQGTSNGEWVPVRNEAVGFSVFGITDFSVNGSGWITLYIVNNAQASVNLTDIRINGSSLLSPTTSLPQLLGPGENLTISGISTIRGAKGDAFYNDQLVFYYTVIGGANHTDSGILRGRID